MTLEWIAVLGASSELATHTIRNLAAQPERRFFLHYRTLSADLESLLGELGPKAVSFRADLSNSASVEDLKQAMLKSCPQPKTILIAATPVVEMRRSKEIQAEDWRKQLEVQAVAPARLLPSFLPAMRKAQTSAQVIFVLSDAVREVPKGMADYVVGKFAALGLMRSLQAEFGGAALTIHAIAPGMMETRFLGALPELAVEAARQQSPDGKLLKVEDCALKLARLIEAPDALKEDPLYLG